MSDESDFEVTPEYVAEMKSRDERIATLCDSMDIQHDMTGNPTIVALQRGVKAGFDQAVEELCATSPANLPEVSRLLVDLKTFVYMRRIFEAILVRGKEAERSLREQDGDL
jgi:hypothetical protein